MPPAPGSQGFNPTLVRLRQLAFALLGTLHRRFNPTLVRLRQIRAHGARVEISAFQSHAGSIEADRIICFPDPLSAVSIPRWFD